MKVEAIDCQNFTCDKGHKLSGCIRKQQKCSSCAQDGLIMKSCGLGCSYKLCETCSKISIKKNEMKSRADVVLSTLDDFAWNVRNFVYF